MSGAVNNEKQLKKYMIIAPSLFVSLFNPHPQPGDCHSENTEI